MENNNSWGISEKTNWLTTGNWFGISEIACQLSAMQLMHRVPLHRELVKWNGRLLTEKFFFISICHQMNWDYLEASIEKLFNGCTTSLEITDKAMNVTADELSILFSDFPETERIRAKERSFILNTTATELTKLYGGCVNILLNESQFHLHGQKGLYENLDQFVEFRKDPLRKKSNVLVHEMMRNGSIPFVDPEYARPAIDYHIIRSYIRTGRVFPTNDQVVDILRSHQASSRIRFITEARLATSKAVQLVADYAKISVAELNYIEWMIARTRCLRNNPICSGCVKNSISKELPLLGGDTCCFSSFCSVNWMNDWTEIWEPVFISSQY